MDNCSVWVQFPTLPAPSGMEGEGVTTKEQHKEIFVRGDETILNPECGASYMNLQVLRFLDLDTLQKSILLYANLKFFN